MNNELLTCLASPQVKMDLKITPDIIYLKVKYYLGTDRYCRTTYPRPRLPP